MSASKISQDKSFTPKHAFITGAAGAIGGALARRLHVNYDELNLTLVDKSPDGLEKIAQALPGRCQTIAWDLAEPETMPALFSQATARFGPVDLLVNCAGIMEFRSFAKTSWKLGGMLLNLLFVTPMHLMQLAVEGMGTGGGSIVNISSMAGRVPLLGLTYYGGAKAGLATASQIASAELTKQGIHVVTVLPGPVKSYLETHAKSQVAQTFFVRNIPTGTPDVLAKRIERALIKRQRMVVYPGIYGIAERFLGLSSRITLPLSPLPNDDAA